MAQIVKELRVDVSQPNVFQAIVAKQNDSNSRFLKITLVDFGVKVEVPNTAKVTINANRPDGASESFKGEANNDGTITVPLAQWMLDIDGEVKCDVSVINTEDNKRLTSTDFWLEVQKAANPNASIPLDPDGEILIIKPVTEINENSKDTDYPSAKAVYDYGQNIVTGTHFTATASGSAITIESANAPIPYLKLSGKTTKDETLGTLSSTGDSGSFEVGVYGKNLFDPNAIYKQHYIINADGTEKYLDNWMLSNNIPIGEKGLTVKAYAVSEGAENFVRVGLYNANGFVSRPTVTERTFTQAEGTYIRISYYQPAITNGDTKCQVELGTVATSYEPPYTKQSLTMPYNLRSVPYGLSTVTKLTDEIDFTNALRTTKTIKVILDGTETIQAHAGGMLYIPLYNIKVFHKFEGSCGLCDQLTNAFSSTATGEVFNVGSEGIYIGKCSKYSTPEELKAHLTSNPMTFIVGLATPIETPLTETELNAYRQLMTNSGTTTIVSEADMTLDYYTPKGQALGNIHSQVNKDYLKLQQAIISTGGSTL